MNFDTDSVFLLRIYYKQSLLFKPTNHTQRESQELVNVLSAYPIMDMSDSLERGMTLNNRTSPILIMINYYHHRKTKIQIFWFSWLYATSVDLFLIPLNLLPTEVLVTGKILS